MFLMAFHLRREEHAGIITVLWRIRVLAIILSQNSMHHVRWRWNQVILNIVSSSSIWNTEVPGTRIWVAHMTDHIPVPAAGV